MWNFPLWKEMALMGGLSGAAVGASLAPIVCVLATWGGAIPAWQFLACLLLPILVCAIAGAVLYINVYLVVLALLAIGKRVTGKLIRPPFTKQGPF